MKVMAHLVMSGAQWSSHNMLEESPGISQVVDRFYVIARSHELGEQRIARGVSFQVATISAYLLVHF
jgi:hypothetical protein